MIPYSDFRRLLMDAAECADFDQYVAEVGGSVPLDDVPQVLKLLQNLWDMAHDGLTIKSIATTCERSVRSIAVDYGLPTRTVESWAMGERTPPTWQLPLIAYAVLSDCLPDD